MEDIKDASISVRRCGYCGIVSDSVSAGIGYENLCDSCENDQKQCITRVEWHRQPASGGQGRNGRPVAVRRSTSAVTQADINSHEWIGKDGLPIADAGAIAQAQQKYKEALIARGQIRGEPVRLRPRQQIVFGGRVT